MPLSVGAHPPSGVALSSISVLVPLVSLQEGAVFSGSAGQS